MSTTEHEGPPPAGPIPFMDLTLDEDVQEAIVSDWRDVLRTSQFVSGPAVERFEQDFAHQHGVRHAVAVSSGTDALVIALRALGAGPGDEVIVPTNSFVATASAVALVGATPVLVDCRADSAGMDLDAAAAAVGPRTVGIVPVHLYGIPMPMHQVGALAERHGLWVLEDAAQAHLAQTGGRRVGGAGTCAAFSFYPGKNLGAAGEGGAITTDHDGIADLARQLRSHGSTSKHHHEIIGYNARMGELMAVSLIHKLPLLAGWTEARRSLAARYRSHLSQIDDIGLFRAPEDAEEVHHLFVATVPRRDEVRRLLDATGVHTGLHYPVPIHRQPAFSDQPVDAPVAEALAEQVVSLPMYPTLSAASVDAVCERLVVALATARASSTRPAEAQGTPV